MGLDTAVHVGGLSLKTLAKIASRVKKLSKRPGACASSDNELEFKLSDLAVWDVFVNARSNWVRERAQILRALEGAADNLDWHHKNVNISTTVGTSVSIVGGIAAVGGIIGGIVAAPVTAGASVAAGVAIAGTVAGVAGGATAAGAGLAETFITRDQVGDITKLLERHADTTKRLMDALTQLSGALDEITEGIPDDDIDLVLKALNGAAVTASAASAAIKIPTLVHQIKLLKALKSAMYKMSQGVGTLRIEGEALQAAKAVELGSNTAKAGGKVLKGTTVVLNVVFIALDTWVLVETAIDIHNGSKSAVAKRIREEMVEPMKKEMNAVNEVKVA
eukprot:TRINITY_DN6716_c0_g1_i3.p1 TRINITY_DN6716_c0_g1~~TRINITY_DN6716_c0_g1_i3.p1  ORF type:complete len:334 (+),score=113.19 TRINITY_DN6716_c0_g1_i3:97-1098(+)